MSCKMREGACGDYEARRWNRTGFNLLSRPVLNFGYVIPSGRSSVSPNAELEGGPKSSYIFTGDVEDSSQIMTKQRPDTEQTHKVPNRK